VILTQVIMRSSEVQTKIATSKSVINIGAFK
jgi:hypothetical protein